MLHWPYLRVSAVNPAGYTSSLNIDPATSKKSEHRRVPQPMARARENLVEISNNAHLCVLVPAHSAHSHILTHTYTQA